MSEGTDAIQHTHSRVGDSGMILNHVQDLQYLRDKATNHDERLLKQELLFDSMTNSLAKISTNMSAVKWTVAGGMVVFCLNQLGVVSTLKLWLHTLI